MLERKYVSPYFRECCHIKMHPMISKIWSATLKKMFASYLRTADLSESYGEFLASLRQRNAEIKSIRAIPAKKKTTLMGTFHVQFQNIPHQISQMIFHSYLKKHRRSTATKMKGIIIV